LQERCPDALVCEIRSAVAATRHSKTEKTTLSQ
jgi:hypothetical protein